ANRRTDRYGGSLAGRLRYPLEVFDAIRAAWPADRPMTVRISATDWHDGGVGADEAVEIARAFAEHGADGIDVSTGQVVSDAGPAARWPDPFAAGSRRPQTGRTDGPRPRLELVRAGPRGTAHARWRPQQDGRA